MPLRPCRQQSTIVNGSLPLAFELFAARACKQTPSKMLHQFDQPLHALVPGPQNVPHRHQTLRSDSSGESA